MPDAKHHTVSRRGALGLLGAVGAAPLLGSATAHAATPSPTLSPAVGGATPVQGLHLTFGKDPSRSMVASWISDGPVNNPRVLFGTLEGGFGSVVPAETKTYVDGTSGRSVWLHHAQLDHQIGRASCGERV